jgi:superfamily I DNA/RNA helicase
MSKPSRLHAFRNAIRKAFHRVAQDAPESKIEPGYFIDLVVFLLALDAYTKMKGEADPHAVEAVRLLRRYQPEVVEGVQKFMQPLAAKGGVYARFRTGVGIASRPTRGVAQAQAQAQVLADMLTVLRTHHDDLKATFSDNRAAGTAQKVANLAASESPETMLNGLATVPPASRLRMTRDWVKDAAKLAGVAPSDTEAVLADAEAAKNIGEDIRAVEAKLNIVDPVSADAADLQEQKQDLLSRLDSVVETSENPTVVLSAAASAAAQDKVYATKVGKAQRLSADQERAMMVRGKGIIAAGAGSGKTKTLASKVVYHIDELGVPPRSIMATSFSRKSAAELKKRIEDYGAAFGNGEDTGLGTTHSVIGSILSTYGGVERDKTMELKEYEQTTLVRLAMKQVEMRGSGKPPPPPTSLLPNLSGMVSEVPRGPSSVAPAAPMAPAVPAAPVGGMTYVDALERAVNNVGRMYGPESWVNWSAQFVNDLWNRGTTEQRLSEKQRESLAKIFKNLRIPYDLQAGAARTAAKKQDNDRGFTKYPSFTTPANQWFNMGVFLTKDGTDTGEPLLPGDFKRAITKFKGRMLSPSEAHHLAKAGELPPELGVSEAAVYAAYEYLKGMGSMEQTFAGKTDKDDLFIVAARALLSNPRALSAVQARYKVVLVDEAQDLNRAQHMLFGLITGYLDPAKASMVGTAKKVAELAKDNGTMTADTYCFIGDDKQAIYEFRGADPEAFIDMSNLVEGGAGFKTEILKTNYRSGELIVQAANSLIAHNKKQIPMTCAANPSRADKGGITRVPFSPVQQNDMSEPAKWFAEQIEEMMELGQGGKKGYDAFGIGLRSNAEAYAYGIELLKKGIPFRAKVNFFGDANTKALLHWLTLVDEGVNGNTERINDAVLNAHEAPTSFLGKTFADTLTKNATGNYLAWLQRNYASIYTGDQAYRNKTVKAYVDNLVTVANLKSANLSSEELLNTLLGMQGADGSTVKDALVKKVRSNTDIMSEIRSADPNGEAPDEVVEEHAMAPVGPLMGLLNSRANITEAMKYVRTLQVANSKLAADDDPEAKGFKEPAVTLGTMHSWKGLEVENMFVPVVGGKFPRTAATEDDLASERRLAYVALTRGENKVFVMDIPTARMTKQGVVISKSQFIEEMCLPSTTPTKTASQSPLFSDAMMEAFLRDEDYDTALANSMGGSSMRAPLWNDTLYTGE